MHTPELGQKLKHLEKLLKETENVAKRYLTLTGRCSTELNDDDQVVIPFDEQLYTKLIKLYHEALSIFGKDEAAIDACLEKVTELQKLGNLAAGGGGMHTGVSGKVPPSESSLLAKRKAREPESPAKKQKRMTKKGPGIPSPTSPIIPSFIANVGDLAAARAPNSDQWILVRIVSYNTKTGRYEVEDDAPDEEEPTAKKFVCSPENIVLLPPDSASIPINANPPTTSIAMTGPVYYLWNPIPQKTPVLAMFPQTTTFYPAKVMTAHKKNKIVQFYQLQFDDDQEGGFTPSRKVMAQYVIPLPGDF